MTTNEAPPKLFISYSWSSQIHEQWVLELAESLVESGVEVLLDRWDLREGHDAVKFMERMVADPEIKKVVMICDEMYAQKADGRNGGVGTETQIISKRIYDNTSQDKFVAVLASKDSQGQPHLPTYYTSRIYIDLSEPDRYSSEFEKLIRWVFDKPLYVRPPIGKRPSYIDDTHAISLGTSTLARRSIDALKQGKSFSSGSLDEYFSVFAENLERFRLTESPAKQDDVVVKSIEEFTPQRNEVISIFQTIAQYSPTIDNAQKVHRFLESIYRYTKRPASVTSYNEWDFDNFKFIVHELFLYALAIFIRHDRFEAADLLLEQPYYIREDDHRAASSASSYTAFRQTVGSLEYRKQRLNLRVFSLHADLLHQRATGGGIDFRYLMQADFISFMREEVANPTQWNRWWPETLAYIGRFDRAFEIFARSASRAYFEKAKTLLGVHNKEEIESVVARYQHDNARLPRYGYLRLAPATLLGVEDLCSRR